MSKLTHLDLFSGIGGFAIAAQNCGFETVGFCEKEPYAQRVLKKHWPDIPIHEDITRLDGKQYAGIDLLTGGFPCQPYSVAGKRKGASDNRALWPEMCRVISESKPAWILGENVAGIVTMELDKVLADLEAIGYSAWPLVIPACAVDASHRRDRVWIIGNADSNSEPACALDAEMEVVRGNVANATERQDWQRNGGIVDGAKSGRQGIHAAVDIGREDVAHSDNGRCGQREPKAEPIRGACGAGEYCRWQDEGEWFAESGMGRISDGIPNRTHRLRGLGNAIVPQIAQEIIMGIRQLL